MANGKIIVHCCGGAASNIANKVLAPIAELGDGFADLIFNYIDTASDLLTRDVPEGYKWKIETSQHGKAAIDGSGGERRTNAADIMASIGKYLDERKYTKMVPNEFHLVVCSASGGSGNVIGGLMIDRLLESNIPSVLLVVGDSSNGYYATNTLNSLASFNAIATKRNKSLGVIYANNHTVGNGKLKQGKDDVNALMQSYVTTLAMFLSGSNHDIDSQDMRGIIDQSNYKTIQINPGLYGLQFFTKEVKKIENSIPTVGRTLTLEDIDFDINVKLLHHKAGIVLDEQAKEMYDGQFPVHMVMFSNFFNIEEENLKRTSDDAYNIAESIKSKTIEGSKKSSVDDDLGIIL